MVVSPCYVPLIFWRDTTGAQDSYQFRVSYDLRMGLTPRPLFYAYPGRGTQLRNSSYEFMETRRAQNTINYTDCTRPLLGSGRNRYMRIMPSGTAERSLFRIVRQKLLYVTYPKLSGPFVEFHKAIFWVEGMGSVLPPPFFESFVENYYM